MSQDAAIPKAGLHTAFVPKRPVVRTVIVGQLVMASFTTEKRTRRECPAIVIGPAKGGLRLFITDPDQLSGNFYRWQTILPHSSKVTEGEDCWDVMPSIPIEY